MEDVAITSTTTERPSAPTGGAKFTRQVFSAVFTNFIIGFVGLATGILLARLLGPQGRGHLAAIQTWPTCLATIATLGLPEALVFLQGRDHANARRHLGSGTVLICCVTPIVAVLGYFLMPLLLASEAPEIIRAARYYMAFVLLYPLFLISLSAFRSTSHIGAWNLLRTAPGVGWLLLIGVAIVSGHTDPVFLAVGNLLVIGALFIVMAMFSVRLLAGSIVPNLSSMRGMLRFGLPTMGSTIPQVLNCRLDQLLLTALVPAQSLGLYIVAVAWGSMANPILSGLSMVLFPHLAALKEERSRQEALHSAMRIGVVLTVAVAFSLAAAAPFVLPVLFGHQFASVVPTAMLLSLAAALTGFNLIVEEGLRGLGQPRIVMWAELSGAAVTALSLFVLLKPLWLLGAALALLIGSATVAVVLIGSVRRLSVCSLRDVVAPSSRDFSLIWNRLVGLGGMISAAAAVRKARLI